MNSNACYCLILLSFLTACGNNQNQLHHPIVLGDSATIITETDAQYLSSNIPDYERLIIQKDTTIANPVEPINTQNTVTTSADKTPDTDVVNAFEVDFGTLKIAIPDVRMRGNEPSNNQAAYTLTQGQLHDKTITAKNGQIESISQQYTTDIVYELAGKRYKLPLRSYTSSWDKLANAQTSNLKESVLRTHNFSKTELKNALGKALRQAGKSRAEANKILNGIRKFQIGQEGFKADLEVVRWKINATDAKGKKNQYRIRVDLPQ